jgi:O-antigen/teichoic acid export membrane protein
MRRLPYDYEKYLYRIKLHKKNKKAKEILEYGFSIAVAEILLYEQWKKEFTSCLAGIIISALVFFVLLHYFYKYKTYKLGYKICIILEILIFISYL